MTSETGVTDAIRSASDHEAAGRIGEALAVAWRAFDEAPDDPAVRICLVRLLYNNPGKVGENREAALRQMLSDVRIDPQTVAEAGWATVATRAADYFSGANSDPARTAQWLETDGFAQELLAATFVTNPDIEAALTAVRRWLLLSGRWRDFPHAVAALSRQAAHNEGAWLYDEKELAHLTDCGESAIASAYHPAHPQNAASLDHADRVTAAVAGQYEQWPYPAWSRLTARMPADLNALLTRLDPDGAHRLPPNGEVLVAGCGTGREAAIWAMTYPHTRITAIDISRSSLQYAASRCAGLGNITFHHLDLHRVGTLGQSFDAVSASGVLHHLPDPEAGWRALTEVLNPGGLMHVMVYSKVARLRVRALRSLIRDLLEKPVDDELLRAVRRRLIESGTTLVRSRDFYTLGGVHDLLLHRHEDPFDIHRIGKAIEALDLKLLAFELPSRAHRARYRANNPHDPHLRDMQAWMNLEKHDPSLFARMYDFWCQKKVA